MIDKNYINWVVNRVIGDQFSSPHKRRTIEHSDRINFCCPYCGDGNSQHKKRGNIYYNKLVYVCFNCDKKTNFTRFCKDFGQTIDPEKKLEILSYLDSIISVTDVRDDISSAHLKNLIPFELLKERISRGDSFIFDLGEITSQPLVSQYLQGRGIGPEIARNIYAAKYKLPGGRWEPVICFLNSKAGKVLSMQVRNLREGKWRMFKVYNFEFLYKFVHSVEEVTELDGQELLTYNKLGYFFGIMDVDFERTITVFEGYLDSLFYPNSIGVIGVNTDISFLENNSLDIQFFYDNDKTGDFKSGEKIKKGYKTFLWKKFFETLVELKKPEDPYQYLHRLSKIKDLNGLAKLVKDPYKTLSLERFFSKDVLDVSWIPKHKKTFRKNIYTSIK
jgi:hypothetical protein